MPENLFIPSVDLRIGALEEYNRKCKEKALNTMVKHRSKACVTISRQYGCQGYPVAVHLSKLLEEKTGEPWLLIDKAVLDEVAKRHSISKEILENLGEKNRILDDLLAVFSPRWAHSQDCFQLLCKHVVSLAELGNVIIMELGGALITKHLEHSFHFRLFASMEFKVQKIKEQRKMDSDEAEHFIKKEQKLRDSFARDFLNHDDNNKEFYNLLFNNDKATPEKIAITIADYIFL